jgi:predicted transcriptional regulator
VVFKHLRLMVDLRERHTEVLHQKCLEQPVATDNLKR